MRRLDLPSASCPLACTSVAVTCTCRALARLIQHYRCIDCFVCFRSTAWDGLIDADATWLLQAYLLGHADNTTGAHFNSFDDRHTFPLLPSPDQLAIQQLTPGYTQPFDYNLVYNSSAIRLAFDTSNSPLLTITNATCVTGALADPDAYENTTCTITVPGWMRVTDNGTQVGLFNFRSIYLGPTVQVTVSGNRALVIISRSSMILDTPIVVQPGTLGVRDSPLVSDIYRGID
jgi:hypothetical protein